MIQTNTTVLVVDDDPAVGKVLKTLLQQDGIETQHVTSGTLALDALETRPFETVITDLQMPGMDGMELLKEILQKWPDLPVIMLTAHGTVQTAVEAMKVGATEFILKPFDREELLFVVRKTLASSQVSANIAPKPATLKTSFIGDSSEMLEVNRMIARAASLDSTVLILGESGTGKELVARAIHDLSPRKDKQLVKVHCAALPETLLESELFGYEKGAFTGAARLKPGRVELAQGGTLFWDEIGDITLATQVKLLRLLQDREYERLGGTQTLKANVRFVAATHRDLETMLHTGEFREDLFYRLNVVQIKIPPLRKRGNDIFKLANHFCASIGKANNKPNITIDPNGMELLLNHSWPGNVRQLQNTIERLVIMSDGDKICEAEIKKEFSQHSNNFIRTDSSTLEKRADINTTEKEQSLDNLIYEAEHEALKQALQRCGNNRTKAARVLQISRRTLYNKLQEHGLE